MQRSPTILSGATLLVAGILFSGPTTAIATATATATSTTTAAGPPDLGRLPDSSTLSTPALSRGVVRTSTGQPAPGASVVLYAWPSNDVTDQQVVGDRVNLQPVAKTTTGSDGGFALRVESLRQLAPFAGRDRIVNLEMFATAADGSETVYNFSRHLEPSATAADPAGLRLGDPTFAADAAQAPAETVDLTLDGAATATGDPAGSSTSDEGAPVAKSCSSSLEVDYGTVWSLVGQHYSATSGVSADFVYTSGADSVIMVASSSSGAYGSFKSAGEISKSSSGSVDFAALSGKANAYRDSKFRYGKYFIQCVAAFGIITQHYEVRATAWSGGSRTRNPSTVAAAYCVPNEAGSTFTKKTTAAVRWTNGVDLSPLIGLDLSIRTGYSTEGAVKFSFDAAHRLCGTADYPGATPYQLKARP